MLEFILGQAGTGKTKEVLKRIQKCLDDKNDSDKIILLVPEQSTLITERLVFDALSNTAFKRVEVLSFNRFAHRIFLETGGIAIDYARGGAKQIITNLVLSNVESSLTLLKNSASRPEFAPNVISMISDFKRYNVTSDDLLKAADLTQSEITRQKLLDISLIYDAYDGMLNKVYKDPDDDLTRLSKVLKKSESITKTSFYFDLFLGFTPQEYLVIDEIIRLCKNVCFSLCYDTSQKDNDMFEMTRRTYETVLEIGQRHKKEISETVLRKYTYSEKADISHLALNYVLDLPAKFSGQAENIKIFCARDIYQEIEFVSSQILALVQKKNYKFSDFLIIAKDQTEYEQAIETVFSKYDIPVFLDKKSDMNSKQVTAMVVGALECVLYDFSYQSVFSYLKMSVLDISFDEMDLLENYVLMWSIHSKDYYKDFYKSPGGVKSADEQQKKQFEDELSRLNDIRKRVFTPLISLKENIKKDSTYRGISEALYKFICEIKLADNIKYLTEEFEKHGQLQLSQEYSQLYNLIIDVLDEIVLVMADCPCTLDIYIKMFKLVISEYSLGSIPASLDCVTFSNIERTASPKAKCAIIIGVNEGVMPHPHKDTSLFYNHEKDELLKLGLYMSRSAYENANYEMQLIYGALFCASDFIMLTYPSLSQSGEVLKPSYIINKIRGCFENLEIINVNDICLTDVIFNKRRAVEALAAGFSADLKNEDRLFLNALEVCITDEKDEYFDLYERVLDFNRKQNLAKISDKSNLSRMANRGAALSASRIESFYSCRFSYFCRYIIGAQKRKTANFESTDVGTFIHFVLELFIKEALKANTSLSELDGTERDSLIERIVSEYIKDNFYDISEHSTRFNYIFNKIKSSLKRIIENISDELSASSFVPQEFEFTIDENSGAVFADNIRRVKLYGKIDRVDVYENDGKLYIRVIDYKTGSKKFDLNDILYGLNIQMLLYLFSIINYYKKEKSKDAISAGVLYFHAAEPVLNLYKDAPNEAIEQQLQKSFKRNGLVLDDIEIISAMENSIFDKSRFIPVVIKGGKVVARNSSVASLEQFESIKNGVQKAVLGMADMLSKGDIKIEPYVKGSFCYCAYCDYKSVCRFDFDRGNTQKKIERHKKDEIFKILDGDEK